MLKTDIQMESELFADFTINRNSNIKKTETETMQAYQRATRDQYPK